MLCLVHSIALVASEEELADTKAVKNDAIAQQSKDRPSKIELDLGLEECVMFVLFLKKFKIDFNLQL